MKNLILFVICLNAISSLAQTDVSLFWRKDSIQINELISDEPYLYKSVGHHGPAVENQYMILRLYYRDGGSIDVYSKANIGLELSRYKWYPSNAEIENGAGCDEYRVGNTVGLGGIALWDGEKEVKLIATKGRDARVKKTLKGAEIEMVNRGVAYKNSMVDIAVRIKVTNDNRWATIEAECISGQKVQFMTGVNYHQGQSIEFDNGHIAVWGIHPADIIEHPLPIGGGMKYNTKKWSGIEKTSDMIQIISKKPCKKVSTQVVAACSREKDVNNEQAFFNLVKK